MPDSRWIMFLLTFLTKNKVAKEIRVKWLLLPTLLLWYLLSGYLGLAKRYSLIKIKLKKQALVRIMENDYQIFTKMNW